MYAGSGYLFWRASMVNRNGYNTVVTGVNKVVEAKVYHLCLADARIKGM